MNKELKNMLVNRDYQIDSNTTIKDMTRMNRLGLDDWVLCAGGSDKSPSTVRHLIEIHDFPVVSYYAGIHKIEQFFKTGTPEEKLLMAQQLELLRRITAIIPEDYCAYNYPITWYRMKIGPAIVTYQNSVTLAQEHILSNRNTRKR